MLTPGPEIGHFVMQTGNSLTLVEQFAQQFIAEKIQFVMENRWLVGALIGLSALYTAGKDILPARRTSPPQSTH